MPKRKESGFELLASMRWPVPVVLGIIACVSIRHAIGWLFGSTNFDPPAPSTLPGDFTATQGKHA